MHIRSRLVSLAVTALFVRPIMAGGGPFLTDALSIAAGKTYLFTSSALSVSDNPANLANLTDPSLGFSISQFYLVKGLQQGAFAFAYPAYKGSAGLSLLYFGDALYNERQVGLAYGYQIDPEVASMGVRLVYQQVSLREYGTVSGLTADIGISAKLKKFTFAGHIFNVFQTRLAQYADERFMSQVAFGVAYKSSEYLTFATQIDKPLVGKPTFRAGIRFTPTEKWLFAVGGGGSPFYGTLGIGLNLSNFKAVLGIAQHLYLGTQAHLSVFWTFGKKQEQGKEE
ncbi:MAG: hypothetical protein GXO48_09455 [Chlorobi bacterium]|nr:hypothetical protein [Chlorobiota bacterium]